MKALRGLSSASLDALSLALERGTLAIAPTVSQIVRVVGASDEGAVRSVLATLSARGMNGTQAAVTLRLLSEARREAESSRARLVWSDHDVRGARDTAVVAQELFADARETVLVSTFSIGHHRAADAPPGHPLLRVLAERMNERPTLLARLFLNIKRTSRQVEIPEAEIVARWTRWFRSEIWPWPRAPEVYFDPRSLAGDGVYCLHAKCIVVDDARALVSSANLTEAAHERNIEAGVFLDDAVFAKELRLQFEALIGRGLVRRLQLP